MKAGIQNFRGIAQAEIEINQIALIIGKNGAGKTSIATAIGAAATGNAIPFAKLAKKDCGIMLHNGQKSGAVTLSGEMGSTMIQWPKAAVMSDGRPPSCSLIAAGMQDLLNMPKKEALDYLQTLLKAEVSESDFLEAMKAEDIEDKAAKRVWLTIEAQGWDGAVARGKETGARFKGAWQQITGQTYGSKVAETWVPDNWSDDLEGADIATLEAALDAARKGLEEAIGKNAINQQEAEKLREDAAALPEWEKKRDELAEKLEALKKEQAEVEERFKNSPATDSKETLTCPHCDKEVHLTAVSGTKRALVKAQAIDEKKLKELRLAYAGICGERENVAGRVNAALKEMREVEQRLSDCTIAAAKLEKVGDAISTDDAAKEVEAKRWEVQTAQARIVTFEKRKDAKGTADMISSNQKIIDLLETTGLRQTKMAQCLDAFQSSIIDPLVETFGAKPLTIDVDLNITLGGTPYAMLSAGEQFRVRCLLQLAIAKIEKAGLVIIDGADILDQGGRNGLLKAVISTGIPAIICVTVNKPDQVPDLAAAGKGVTYWVEAGSCQPVAAKPKSIAA